MAASTVFANEISMGKRSHESQMGYCAVSFQVMGAVTDLQDRELRVKTASSQADLRRYSSRLKTVHSYFEG